MKKICFFMATPFTKGGEQRVVSILSNLLIENSYDVTIMCTDMTAVRNNSLYNLSEKVKIDYVKGFNNKYVIKIRNKRYKLYKENLISGKYKNSLSIQKFINCDPITQFLLVNAFNKEEFDYVISLSTIYNTMLACVSDKLNAKTIGWQHSCSERYFGLPNARHYNQDKFTKYMLKKLDSYVVLTNHDKKYIKKHFNCDVTVLNNPKSIISNKKSTLINNQFLAVGRFVSVKNFEKLIDMFKEYHKYNNEWKLIIVGEGELKKQYIKKIKEYGLEEYILIKNYTKNISKYYLDSSIYLMSSLYEGWGMVIGEAIEFGLPVISFDISSAPEMIKNNYNGYIAKNEKEYINKMIELSNDKDLLKKFSINSINISNSFDNQIIINKWISLFDRLEAPEEKHKFGAKYAIINN